MLGKLTVGLVTIFIAASYIYFSAYPDRPENEHFSSNIYTTGYDPAHFDEMVSGDASLFPDAKDIYTSADKASSILRWGIKRNKDNLPPQADPGAPALLEKYNGKYIGDIEKKTIYLTFDEGYENGYTPKILDVLSANNVKAAFFITGPYLKGHQDLVRRMVEEGHTVGNHTVHHPSLPAISNTEIENELIELERAFKEKFNKDMKFLRPPKGEYSERTLDITNRLGYVNLFWSFAYDDWYKDKTRGAEYAFDKVVSNIHNGAVILLHAVSKDNADALDGIIKELKRQGYEFGDINEIVKAY